MLLLWVISASSEIAEVVVMILSSVSCYAGNWCSIKEFFPSCVTYVNDEIHGWVAP